MKQLNQKLVTENATLIQADKGKTIIIIKSDAYSNKVHTFLPANNFLLFPKNTTYKYQKLIQKNIAMMQLNHTQTQNKIPHPKETITTNTKCIIKIT